MISLSDLAKKTKISKSSLNRRMKKIPNFKVKYCSTKNNRMMIKEDGAKKISYAKHNSTSKFFHTRAGTEKNQLTSAKKTEIINQLLDLNESYQKQIKQLQQANKRKIKLTYGQAGLPTPSDINELRKNAKLERENNQLLTAKLRKIQQPSLLQRILHYF